MDFNTENRSGGENRQLINFVSTISLTMAKLYDENENEEYRQALKDTCYEICKFLEPIGASLNRTPLTASWLDSNERKELRRKGLIK